VDAIEGPTARGRRRDPVVDSRILDGAARAYVASGWAGFTFEAVARAARVGKPAIYLRWASREELLWGVVDATAPGASLPDTGGIRADLIGMADSVLDGYVQGPSSVSWRLQMDVRSYPDLLEPIHERLVLARREASRAMVLRGIERGELRPDTKLTVLLDLVSGAMANHWGNSLTSERPAFGRHRDAFVADVVDAALASFLIKPSS
jgi:AcrR family transcriptional regulator